MKRRFLPLTIALAGLLAFVAVAAMKSDTPQPAAGASLTLASELARAQPRQLPQPAPAPAHTPADGALDAAPAAPTTPAAEAAPEPEQPSVKTGCGKAVPCPNRSCEDCPFNIYLK